MNVTDELGKIHLFLTDDGLVAILEEVPMTMVAPIVRERVAREKAAHKRR